MPFNIGQAVEDRVCRDLLAFADSRTTVERVDDEFRWTWKRKPRSIQVLSLGDEGFPNRVAFEGQEFDYPDFFASDEMGALLWLAQEIERSLAQLKLTYPTETIPAKVRLDDDGDPTTFSQALADVTAGTPDSTSLVFLQGRAGDGKSTSLIDLTHRQAADYAAGRSRFVYLYIDAQGRSLSRLDEAVALILDDLNASFRYQSLAVLTRLSLIVPVVDGFDELLGSGGYAEAFASLEAFLFRLEGRGTVVTSARSTFYQQSALSRAAARLSAQSSNANITIHNIHLLPWDQESTELLLGKLGVAGHLLSAKSVAGSNDLYSAAQRDIGPGAEEILSSPLLTGAYASLLKEGNRARASGSIVEAAIRALVQREIKEKLLGARGDQILDEQQFERLFAAIAEEMWWQETRTLDEDTLVLVADMTLDELGVEKGKASALLNKLSSNAVVDLGEGARKLSFRHEIYFSFFLGNYFRETLLSAAPKDVARLLGRALLPATLSRQCAWLLRSVDEYRKYLANLAYPIGQSAASDLINSNRGTLIAGALKHSHHSSDAPVRFSDAVFSAADLSNAQLGSVEFLGCTFDEVDITGMNAARAIFTGCTFRLPLVDDSTVVNFGGMQLGREVVGVRVRRDGVETTVYRAAQSVELMEKLGLRDVGTAPARTLSERERKTVEAIERVLRFASRSIYFSENDFENRGFAKDLLPIGERHGIWTASEKQRRGVRTVYRLSKTPDAVISGVLGDGEDEGISSFWRDLLGRN